MNRENTPPILYVIVTLLVVNLAATVWIGTKSSPTIFTGKSAAAPEEPFPDYITKETKSQIYGAFRKAFNSRDLDTFFALFSDIARAQMKKADVKTSYDQLLDYFGGVEEGIFSHYEYAGRQGNLKVFILYYIVTLPETSKFGRQGELKITITDDGQEYGIVSAFLQSKTQ